MKFRISILSLLVCLVVAASATRVTACGEHDAEHTKYNHEKPDAGNQDFQTGTSDNGSKMDACCAQRPSGEPCSDDDGCGHCHCPGCGTIGHAPVVLTPLEAAANAVVILAASIRRQAFYFSDHLPEAVYLPIWQPPKLGV